MPIYTCFTLLSSSNNIPELIENGKFSHNSTIMDSDKDVAKTKILKLRFNSKTPYILVEYKPINDIQIQIISYEEMFSSKTSPVKEELKYNTDKNGLISNKLSTSNFSKVNVSVDEKNYDINYLAEQIKKRQFAYRPGDNCEYIIKQSIQLDDFPIVYLEYIPINNEGDIKVLSVRSRLSNEEIHIFDEPLTLNLITAGRIPAEVITKKEEPVKEKLEKEKLEKEKLEKEKLEKEKLEKEKLEKEKLEKEKLEKEKLEKEKLEKEKPEKEKPEKEKPEKEFTEEEEFAQLFYGNRELKPVKLKPHKKQNSDPEPKSLADRFFKKKKNTQLESPDPGKQNRKKK